MQVARHATVRIGRRKKKQKNDKINRRNKAKEDEHFKNKDYV